MGYAEHVFNGGSVCATCGYVVPHTHEWATNWTTDDTYHWHECTSEVGTCDAAENAQKDGYGEHVYDNDTDYACNICNYTIEHTHEWAETWTANSTHHWHKCVSTVGPCDATQNTDMDSYGPHVYDDDTDPDCNSCGYERTITPPGPGPEDPDPGHKPEYKFDTDTTAFVSGVVSLFDGTLKAALPCDFCFLLWSGLRSGL